MSQKHQDERVIIIAPVGQDAAAMAGLLSAEGFAAHVCEDVFECSRQLMAGAGVFLLTEEALDSPGVSDLLEVLKAQPSWSELPLIILTSGGELRAGRLSNLTAADAGAVTLLERPLNMRTLVRSVQVALRSRQRQYQVRDLIDQQQRHIEERKQAEEALRESQAALEFALESAQVGDWNLDLIHDTSRRSLRHDQCFGYNEPIPEKDWGFEVFIQHVHPGDRARVEQAFQEAIGGLKDWQFECRVVWPDESIHWIAVHGSIYHAEDGKPVRMLGIIANITERRQAEEALLESRQRITNIVESITDAFTTVDKEWRYTFLNQRAEEILLPLQKSRENLLGKSIWEEFPDLIGTVVEEKYRRCMAEQVPVEFELFYPPLDGWFEVRAFPSKDGISSYFQDITERKKGEEALRESEERFRLIVSIITDVPWTTDAEGAFVVPQLAWEKFSGQSWEEHRGFGWTNALHPEDREAVKAIWEAAKQARSLYESRGRLWHGPSQQYRHFVARATPLFDANGDMRAWVGACTDCHDAEVAEEKLRESEARFRQVADTMPQMVWTARPDGFIDYYNERWYEFTGFPRDEFGSSSWEPLLHPDDVQRCVEIYFGCIRSGQPYQIEYRFKDRATGDWRWFMGRALPVRDERGEITRWFGTCTDIHDQRRAMEEIARASRAKDDFLAALSHELRTPLTPVLMTAAALESDTALPLEVRDQLGMMRRNIELEARLIDDLLDITRITRGKLNLAPIAADLHQLLEHTAEIVRSDELGKQVRVVFSLEAERHHALADPPRLQQVFWNLIKNALKFTPTGGSIAVRTRNDAEGWIVVRVEDDGVGISAEALPHIFTAFEQGDVAGQHRYGGLGLGLAISQAIVEAHSGAIRAESAGLGCGATFTVRLASIDAPAEGLPAPTASSAPAPALRLLLVEDHEATRTVLAQLLTRSGHQVTAAGTIHEALLAFSAERFDAVVSDLGLPDGSGLDLMGEIQRQRPVPGIAMSGYGMENDLRQTREAGFFAHLVKPVKLDEFRQLLAQLTKRV